MIGPANFATLFRQILCGGRKNGYIDVYKRQDKLCDQISDGVLDAILAQDPQARVACEVMAATGMVMVAGEIIKPIPAAELDLGEVRSAAKLRQNKQLLLDAWEQLYQENKFQ